jgi:UDP-glucose 4-epimerase
VIGGIDALVSGRVTNQIINLAYGHGSTLVDVVNIASLALGRKAEVTYEPTRAGEVTRYVADISKARELLGYEPKTPLSAGLGLSIEWQKAEGYLKG